MAEEKENKVSREVNGGERRVDMYVWSRARGSGKMSGGSERMKGDGIDR